MGTEIHGLAVLVAGLSGFAVGGLWYGPLFLAPWLRAEGKTREQMGGGHPAMVFGLAFLCNLFSAFILDHTFGTYGDPTMGLSIAIALGVAFGFELPSPLSHSPRRVAVESLKNTLAVFEAML